uniref:Cilia- and flagella-associated protein 58 central coiled coil domain-containing protein n=1 Tax=Prymnesium polylepis TaxID=72548 RepID=A0A7S4NGC8_9EUKA
MKVDKEKEALREALSTVIKQEEVEEAKELRFKAEVGKLNQIINEAEAERMKQQKEYDIVVNERDILGTQLIKRNDELAQLYEKIKLQQCTLNQGERQYSERQQDLGALQKDTSLLRSELIALKASVSSYDSLRSESFQLQRELLQERTKVRALSEELENPMNVHRWRKLEGSDPATYELVQKIHMLQKRLIEKSEEVVDKELLIQHKEKLYIELKAILARQPGPEVAEQLSVYQQSLQERNKQMQLMNAELTMSHTQVSEYKYEIERITKELREVKKKFYDQKKREQHSMETRRIERATPAEVLVQEARASMNRFTGGGFNLNMPAS